MGGVLNMASGKLNNMRMSVTLHREAMGAWYVQSKEIPSILAPPPHNSWDEVIDNNIKTQIQTAQ